MKSRVTVMLYEKGLIPLTTAARACYTSPTALEEALEKSHAKITPMGHARYVSWADCIKVLGADKAKLLDLDVKKVPTEGVPQQRRKAAKRAPKRKAAARTDGAPSQSATSEL